MLFLLYLLLLLLTNINKFFSKLYRVFELFGLVKFLLKFTKFPVLFDLVTVLFVFELLSGIEFLNINPLFLLIKNLYNK